MIYIETLKLYRIQSFWYENFCHKIIQIELINRLQTNQVKMNKLESRKKFIKTKLTNYFRFYVLENFDKYGV